MCTAQVSLASNQDGSRVGPSGRSFERETDWSHRAILVAEAWPGTDLVEGTAALTSCLMSALRLLGDFTSNEVREFVLQQVSSANDKPWLKHVSCRYRSVCSNEEAYRRLHVTGSLFNPYSLRTEEGGGDGQLCRFPPLLLLVFSIGPLDRRCPHTPAEETLYPSLYRCIATTCRHSKCNLSFNAQRLRPTGSEKFSVWFRWTSQRFYD